MSHVSPKINQGWIPCEFAAMHDCTNSDDEEFCRTYKDPGDCASYHRRMVLEKEETKEEYEKWFTQMVYSVCIKDDKLRCTCDEFVREESFFQAQGHYHHCMLYQVTRAIELSLKYSSSFGGKTK